jgi:Protein of unknown function (DUF2842)
MHTPLRKIIGTIVLLAYVMVYAFVVMVIADLKLQDASQIIKLTYFLVTGILWIFPAMLLIRWMEKIKKSPPTSS